MSDGGRGGRIEHVVALDGARGLAVAGVVLFHAGHLDGGYLGVDFFFVLSGYLITSLLLAEAASTDGVGLGGFWSRRARRLLPALAVLILAVAAYCVLFAAKAELVQIRGDAFATVGYVANWREVFSHQDYFALFSTPSPLNHTWSLAIEEQFYIVWPLVFVALLARFRRRTPMAVLVTALGLAAVSSALMILLYSPTSTTRAYFGTDTRAAAILFGAAFAAWSRLRPRTTDRSRRIALEVLAAVGVVVLAIAWSRLDGESPTLYRGGFLVCGLAATAVIAAAVHPDRGPIARVLAWRPFVELGLISYGVYLYHWPIDVWLDKKRMRFGGWPLVLFQIAVTLVVSVASFHLVERPIRRGAIRARQLRSLTPAVALGLVVAIFVATAGGKERPTTVTALGRHPIGAAQLAYRIAPPNSTRVMIVGDSVGYFLGKSFQKLAAAHDLSVLNAGLEGCNIYPNATEARYTSSLRGTFVQHIFPCDPPWQPAAVKAFKPQVVYWITSNPAEAFFVDGHWVDTCSAEYASTYAHHLRETLDGFRATGARVVMTTEVYPRYPGADSDTQTDCDNRLRRAAAASAHVQLVDLQHHVCPTRECRETEGGVKLRSDGEHFEGPGGNVVATWLLGQAHLS